MTHITAFFLSMTGRIFAILVAGIVITAIGTWTIATMNQEAAVRRLDEQVGADRLQTVISRWLKTPAGERAAFDLGGRPKLNFAPENGPATTYDPSFTAEIASRFPSLDVVAARAPSSFCHPIYRDVDRPGWDRPCEVITVREGGQTLRLRLQSQPIPPPGLVTLSPVSLAALVIAAGLLALFVARMASQPLMRLSRAAVALGDDLSQRPLALSGPVEVRTASNAFNMMQARLQRQLAERTQMLAAITHDLQTPVTRLRLRLEKVKEADLRDRLLGDLSAIKTLMREGLELARSVDYSEKRSLVDLQSLIDSIADDAADAGQTVTVANRSKINVMVQPEAFRRCVANLIDNALKYGGCAELSIVREADSPTLRVRDRGPGLPEDHLETVFEPFFRLDTSRSRRTGGVGLGLAIARTIAQRNAVDISLRNHPEGGAEAVLRFQMV